MVKRHRPVAIGVAAPAQHADNSLREIPTQTHWTYPRLMSHNAPGGSVPPGSGTATPPSTEHFCALRVRKSVLLPSKIRKNGGAPIAERCAQGAGSVLTFPFVPQKIKASCGPIPRNRRFPLKLLKTIPELFPIALLAFAVMEPDG